MDSFGLRIGLVAEAAQAGGQLLERPNCYGFGALGTLLHRELNTLVFDQRSVSLAFDGREMDEDIIARISGDEAEALYIVEPFDGTGFSFAHVCTP